jgi:pyridinium-3,5-biscarboxylic acid mononucleotide synthase
MNRESLEKILAEVHANKMSPETALSKLENLPYEDLSFARIDHHRSLRGSLPEAIFCENKTPDQVLAIVESIRQSGTTVLGTRLSEETYASIETKLPEEAKYDKISRTLVLKGEQKQDLVGNISILCAGTSDIPVAEEAAITAETFNNKVERIYDVGVAGVHRLFDQLEKIKESKVIIVIAGMDGALPSVVGGLVAQPVIAVPTSVGYGAAFNGLAPLLAMLNSCAPGVAIVNIDNGFGAACMAHKINALSNA